MANPKVHICGHPKIYVPDDDCSECIMELDKFKNEVHHNYYNKTEVENLVAGAKDGGFILVDQLPASGENGYIYLVPETPPDTGYEQWIWTNDGWVDLGKEELTLDKQSILTALGYEEVDLSMTDTDGNTVTITVIKSIS